MWLFCLRLPVKWRAQGTCDSPLVWPPWLLFCKDQKHCKAVWLASKRWEWGIMPKEQKVGSKRMGIAIMPRGWDGEKSRDWGHVEQPQAADGSPLQSRGVGKASPGPQPSGRLAVPRWPNASCWPERSLVRAIRGKGPTDLIVQLQLKRNLTPFKDTRELAGWDSFSIKEMVSL